ncbi:MAG: hypothetical protein ACU83U_07015 [Gammaproteobacteria bacterium]
MNTTAKKTLLVGFALLLSACAHYPQHHAYYPSDNGYSRGYTIIHRNYYGGRPNHYDSGHGKAYYPHHNHHDYYNSIPRHGNNNQGHQQQRDKSYDRHNDFGRRNYH